MRRRYGKEGKKPASRRKGSQVNAGSGGEERACRRSIRAHGAGTETLYTDTVRAEFVKQDTADAGLAFKASHRIPRVSKHASCSTAGYTKTYDECLFILHVKIPLLHTMHLFYTIQMKNSKQFYMKLKKKEISVK